MAKTTLMQALRRADPHACETGQRGPAISPDAADAITVQSILASILATAVLLVHTEALAGNCFIRFGSSTCPPRMGADVVSLGTDLASCTAIGTQANHPIDYYSWSKPLLPNACTAAGYPATVPVAVCYAEDPTSYTATSNWTVQGSCNPTPVHLVIQSWVLDMNSLKVNPSAPCTVDVSSQLTVANVGTADYTGGYTDARIGEGCGNTLPWGCGNQGWGSETVISSLVKGQTKVFLPTTTGQDSPFHIDCSPPSPSKTVNGGSYLAKWVACRSDITCDPSTPVATPDLLSVCSRAKAMGLLNACH